MTERERHLKVLEEFYRHHYQYDCGDYSGIGDDVAKAIKYAINSIKTDLKYDLLYEGEEPTTKNDLGVDLISRADALDCVNWGITFSDVYKKINDLPSVTSQEPKIVPIAEIKYDKDKLKELIDKAVLTVIPQEPSRDMEEIKEVINCDADAETKCKMISNILTAKPHYFEEPQESEDT